MGKHLLRGAGRRTALLTAGMAAAACALPASGHAATITPFSNTDCKGSLTPDSSGKAKQEPNLLDYSFSCDSGITAYSIIAYQQRNPSGSLDDFNPSPLVLETDDLTPSSTETVVCSGVLPGNGINCNTGALGSQITLGYYVSGSIDPVQAYCKHFPVDAKGQTLPAGALTVPTMRVQLVVTDWTGAQDGPFLLKQSKACPTVPDRVPPGTTTSTTKKSTKPATSARHTKQTNR